MIRSRYFALLTLLVYCGLAYAKSKEYVYIWHDNPPIAYTGSIPFACDAGPAVVTAAAALEGMNDSVVVEDLVIPPGYSYEGHSSVVNGRHQLRCTFLFQVRNTQGVSSVLGIATFYFVSTREEKRQLDYVRVVSYPTARVMPFFKAFNCAAKIDGGGDKVTVDAFEPSEGEATSCVKKHS